MAPLIRFFDRIVQHRAWSPAFFEGIKRDFPQTYAEMDYKTAFYRWCNSFKGIWPSMLQEPESEKYHLEDVKLRAVIALIQVFEPILDIENKLALYQWATDNISENKTMFITPLEFDFEALEKHLDEMQEQQDEQQDLQMEGMRQGTQGGGVGGGAQSGGQQQSGMVKMAKADDLAGRFDKASAILGKISPEAREVIPIERLRKTLMSKSAGRKEARTRTLDELISRELAP
jgi:hypothetical protein